MYGTGMQNPIFGMMNQITGNLNTGMNMNQMVSSQNMNNMNNMYPNMMGQNMNVTGLMNNNNMGNPGLNNFNNMGNSQLMNANNMMNNQIYSPMNNPAVNNMYNQMTMAQMSQQLQNQYQNQLQNMNMNMGSDNQTIGQSQNFSAPPGNNFITLVFRNNNSQDNKPIKIQCTISDRLSEVFDRYRTKAQDNDKTKKFIFNAKQLDENMTVGEADLTEGSNIFVVTTTGIYGAY